MDELFEQGIRQALELTDGKKGLAGSNGLLLTNEFELSDSEFKSLCEQNGMIDASSEEAKEADPAKVVSKDRILTFIGSDESQDKHGDVISVAGWMLEEYRKNPVFLLNHNMHELPIGRTMKVWKANEVKGTGNGRALMFNVFFPTKDINEKSDQVFNLFKAKILNSVSVGFKPKEYVFPKGDEERSKYGVGDSGVYHKKQMLFELSAVSIPANGNAVRVNSAEHMEVCKSLGITAELEPVTDTEEPNTSEKSSEDAILELKSMVEDLAEQVKTLTEQLATRDSQEDSEEGEQSSDDEPSTKESSEPLNMLAAILEGFTGKSNEPASEEVDFSVITNTFKTSLSK